MKRLWKNRGGFTLVEIIVTFTLTAIFMSSAAMVLTTFMRSHTVASAVATEQDVASIVMDTITSSLDGARYGVELQTGDDRFNPEDDTKPTVTDSDTALLIQNDGGSSVVWYFDEESGNIVKMYRKEEDGKGYLAMDYFVDPGPETVPGERKVWEKVPWKLGTGVYQNCSLEKFEVSQIKTSAGKETSYLSITLTIKNPLAGDENTFQMKRAVDCYNLAAKNIEVS